VNGTSPKPVLVKFVPHEREYAEEEALSLLRETVPGLARVRFYDIGNSPEFREGPGLPLHTSREEVGLQLRIARSVVLSLWVTDKEAAAIKKMKDVAALENSPVTRVLSPNTAGQDVVSSSLRRINVEEAWKRTKGAPVKIGLLDSGVDSAHPDLAVSQSLTFVAGTAPTDVLGHGTRCAGILNARENQAGLIGVAPQADLYSLKVVGDSGDEFAGPTLGALLWCTLHGVQVASASIGFEDESRIAEWVCAQLSAELLIVAAAGNNGLQGGQVLAPARFASVVAVSAVAANDRFEPTSSFGREIDICAPGVNVPTTKNGGRYTTFSGTSAACPIVAGAAALVFARFASTSPSTNWVRTRLQETAHDLGPEGWDKQFGTGLVDADRATL
jgi:subtilisin